MHQVPHELLNKLRLRILVNEKKCKNIPEMFGFDGEYTAEQQNLDFFW